MFSPHVTLSSGCRESLARVQKAAHPSQRVQRIAETTSAERETQVDKWFGPLDTHHLSGYMWPPLSKLEPRLARMFCTRSWREEGALLSLPCISFISFGGIKRKSRSPPFELRERLPRFHSHSDPPPALYPVLALFMDHADKALDQNNVRRPP